MKIINIENPFKNAEIYYKSVTDSTMNDARSLILDNPESGTVVFAGEQLSGRGRIPGRKWYGGKDLSLMFTLLFKEKDIQFYKTLFPLFAGYCIMSCLKNCFSIESRVKWPNDVLVGGKKISGVLCENTDSYILCGCGINLNQRDFPRFDIDNAEDSKKQQTVSKKAVSIYQITGKNTAPEEILIKLLKEFKYSIVSLKWKALLEKNLYLKDKYAVVDNGIPGKSKKIKGFIEGIGDYGQLFVREERGLLHEVYSGEINFD